MRAWVSFVNLRHDGTGVWLWDGETLEPFAVETRSAVGMALHEGLLYVAAAGEKLFTVDADTRTVVAEETMPTSAAHSIAIADDRMFVVSTGSGGIYSRPLGGERWETVGVHGQGGDTYHVNSITSFGGEVVVSAFGPKEGPAWGTNGYILNLATGERLVAAAQPHSLLPWRDDLWFCESATGCVRSIGGDKIDVGGYTRGLAPLDDRTLLVGVSDSRNAHTGTSAALWTADVVNQQAQQLTDVAHVGPEIYAVVTEAGGA